MKSITPITAADLVDVGHFLHENLNRRISASAWTGSFGHRWAESSPNHGMQLRVDGRIVGVFCAIYSDQWIDGRLEKFCNPHSWCVLDEYRNQSIGLILPLLKQPGYHFTMFTPNPKVAEVFKGLKFRNLANGLVYFPNVPSARFILRRDEFIVANPASLAAKLPAELRDVYDAHRTIPWLRFAAFGRRDDLALLVYKRDSGRRVPFARIIHISDRSAFDRYGHLVKTHLFCRGLPLSRIETRFLTHPPAHSRHRIREQPKLVLSKTLGDEQISDLYSELAALDV